MTEKNIIRKLKINCIVGFIFIVIQVGFVGFSIYRNNILLLLTASICMTVVICAFLTSYKCYKKVKIV